LGDAPGGKRKPDLVGALDEVPGRLKGTIEDPQKKNILKSFQFETKAPEEAKAPQ